MEVLVIAFFVPFTADIGAIFFSVVSTVWGHAQFDDVDYSKCTYSYSYT